MSTLQQKIIRIDKLLKMDQISTQDKFMLEKEKSHLIKFLEEKTLLDKEK